MAFTSEINLERVSCKAALYGKSRTSVLLVQYLPGHYGLPGGHTEPGETPDEAMRRELQEELDIEGMALERRDFWRHSDGKIVLGFTGDIDSSTEFSIDKNEIEAVEWVDVSDIKSGHKTAGGYDGFILQESGLVSNR